MPEHPDTLIWVAGVKPAFGGEVVSFQANGGKNWLDVQLDQNTVWLNQAPMVALFERDVSVISRHIRNVFSKGELPEKSNLQK